MRIYILGIAGTFMGSLAQLATALGHEVYGVDAAVYPPMSDQLHEAGIAFDSGYEQHRLAELKADCVIVGNAISRGNPALEYVLNEGLAYCSAPQWIAENILSGHHVLAVSGTHGKTTTSSMLAWMLEYAGLEPGYLIGGVPENFGCSARLGNGKYFVIEADEYDSAFCDKRSKFVHYKPDTLVINNIEFDHADIFASLADIQKQFHHVVRTVPANGQVLFHDQDTIKQVLEMGCWSGQIALSGESSRWSVEFLKDDLSEFRVSVKPDGGNVQSSIVKWSLSGEHNIANALSAIVAASCVGVSLEQACAALGEFQNVKRRMQLIAEVDGIKIFDDFAHHPTAIRLTLEGAMKKYPRQRLVAVIEARSNTMQQGVHDAMLPDALSLADSVYWCSNAESSSNPDLDKGKTSFFDSVDALLDILPTELVGGDIVIIMSNGGFGGIHQKLLQRLQENAA